MTFTYETANGIIETSEAFGQVWQEAKAYAAANHTAISRLVNKDGETHRQYYAIAGAFLDEKHFVSGLATIKIW